jgi:thiosulfate/3-mercaptopyruvate sulfurtransferase
MTLNISTQALAEQLDNPEFVVVDVREMAAFNGWQLHGEARGGHMRGAVAFPLRWTTMVGTPALQVLLASKGITTNKTIVVYDVQRQRSAAMSHLLRTLGYSKVLTYEAGVAAWAAEPHLPMAHLARYEKLVYPTWVQQLLEGKRPATYPGHGFVILEVGWDARDATAYHRSHIPGAGYMALDTCERVPLWNRVSDTALAAQLMRHGVRYDTTVVLYSRDTTAAARAATLLLYAGVEDVRLLDGGWVTWQAAGYAVETKVQLPLPCRTFGRTSPAHPEYMLDTAAVQARLGEADTALVSVQSWVEYIGVTSGYGYIQPKGRIAGAVWGHAGSRPRRMDHFRNVDNTMRNYHDIAARWRAWGVRPDQRVAFYCGTSWRASEAFFSAYLMGWDNIAVYDGGWLAWSREPSRPMARGAPPSIPECACLQGYGTPQVADAVSTVAAVRPGVGCIGHLS